MEIESGAVVRRTCPPLQFQRSRWTSSERSAKKGSQIFTTPPDPDQSLLRSGRTSATRRAPEPAIWMVVGAEIISSSKLMCERANQIRFSHVEADARSRSALEWLRSGGNERGFLEAE